MTEATKTERRIGDPRIMHDLNLKAMGDYEGGRPDNPAAELLIASCRVALETQAIATEAMSCAAYFGAFDNMDPNPATGSLAREAYDLAVQCQQYAGLVANKYADLTHGLRVACLNGDKGAVAKYRRDAEQMKDWRDQAAAKSGVAAAVIRRALALMGIDQEGE